MRIATWNLERLIKKKNQQILEKLDEINADILVLTETSSKIQLENYNLISTEPLPNFFDNIKYDNGENRVSIFTKYKILTQYKTFDNYTTVCADIETPNGRLTVYGSIIGVLGNRQPRFDNDLNGHLTDFEKIISSNMVCIAGDLNVMFSGRPWPSKRAKDTLLNAFDKYNLTNTTSQIDANVDHIILSNEFLRDKNIHIETWNIDKTLSDHVGHVLNLT
jgi:exonuclease III